MLCWALSPIKLHVCKKAVVEGQGVSMLCVLCYACSGLHFHTQVKAMLGAPKGKDASGLSDDETIEKCLNEVEAALNAGLNFKGKFNSGLQVHLPTVHLTLHLRPLPLGYAGTIYKTNFTAVMDLRFSRTKALAVLKKLHPSTLGPCMFLIIKAATRSISAQSQCT